MVLREHVPPHSPGCGKAGTFTCREDKEHTDRAVAAICRRKREEARAPLIDIRTSGAR